MQEIQENPLVSVIIPIYNVEKYLRECLDSVINQTLREIEIICVNDGSTDSSGEIVQEYAKRDCRIVYVEQQNSGQSIARNIGLERVKGEWIYFLDADDYIDLDCLEEMVSALRYGDVVCNTNIVFEYPTHSETCLYKEKKQGIFTLNPRTIKFFEYYAVHILFKKDIIKHYGIIFPPHRSNAEDSDFLYRYLCFMPHICFINTSVYHYRQRQDSTIGILQQTQQFPLEPLDTFASIYHWYKQYGVLEKYSLPFKLLYSFSLQHSNAENFFIKAKNLVRNLGIAWDIVCNDKIMQVFMETHNAKEFIHKRDVMQGTLERNFRIRLFKKYSVIKIFGITLFERFADTKITRGGGGDNVVPYLLDSLYILCNGGLVRRIGGVNAR